MNRRWINQDALKAAIRANVRSMVETGRLVPLGVSKTGARCYGIPEGK